MKKRFTATEIVFRRRAKEGLVVGHRIENCDEDATG